MNAIIASIQAFFSGDLGIALLIGIAVAIVLAWKTRGWVKDVDWRIKGLAIDIDQRIERFEANVDQRIEKFEVNVDQRIERFEVNVDQQIKGLATDINQRIERMVEEQKNQKNVLNEVKSDVSALKSDVSDLKSDVSILKSDVSILKSDVSDLKSDVSGLKSNVSDLKSDVSGLKSDVSGLKSDVSDLKSSISDLNNNVFALCQHLIPSSNKIARAASPLKLTEYGEGLSQKIDAEQIADVYADKIKLKVADKNAYEIQQYCSEYAQSDLLKDLQQSDKDKYDTIAACAFDEGIDIDQPLGVIALVLRDKLFTMLDILHDKSDKNTLSKPEPQQIENGNH